MKPWPHPDTACKLVDGPKLRRTPPRCQTVGGCTCQASEVVAEGPDSRTYVMLTSWADWDPPGERVSKVVLTVSFPVGFQEEAAVARFRGAASGALGKLGAALPAGFDEALAAKKPHDGSGGFGRARS